MAVQYGPLVVKENLQKLLRLQKLAARILPKNGHFCLFIPFYAESYVNRCTLTYKRLKGNTPEYINDLLIKNSDMHNKTTRYCIKDVRAQKFPRTDFF